MYDQFLRNFSLLIVFLLYTIFKESWSRIKEAVMFILMSTGIILLLIGLLGILLKQSKKPTGALGFVMMRLWNKVYLPLVKWAMEYIDLNAGSTVLDIGIGNGASSAYLAQKFHTVSVTGIDLSPDAISHAKKRYLPDMFHFETMDVHNLTFEADQFDLVTAFQTHFHWNNLKQALDEIHRVLKQEGLVVLACETAKINYFLPELKNSTDFSNFVSKIGFTLTNQHTTNQWKMYILQKN